MATQDTPKLNQLRSVPNLVSLSRLLALPFLIYLVIEQQWIWSVGVAVIFGLTDFLDGYLARKLNQSTALGAVLDPVIDRLFILGLLIAMVVSDIMNIMFLLVLLSRDISVLIAGLIRRRSAKVTVVYVGKIGTWILYVSFALILLSEIIDQSIIIDFAQAGFIWGAILYWIAGYRYISTPSEGAA